MSHAPYDYLLYRNANEGVIGNSSVAHLLLDGGLIRTREPDVSTCSANTLLYKAFMRAERSSAWKSGTGLMSAGQLHRCSARIQ